MGNKSKFFLPLKLVPRHRIATQTWLRRPASEHQIRRPHHTQTSGTRGVLRTTGYKATPDLHSLKASSTDNRAIYTTGSQTSSEGRPPSGQWGPMCGIGPQATPPWPFKPGAVTPVPKMSNHFSCTNIKAVSYFFHSSKTCIRVRKPAL